MHHLATSRPRVYRLIGVFLIASAGFLWAQSLPVEPARETGNAVTGAFEGWFKNPDGTFSLLLGYYNRNLKQTVDLPIGPNNRIEPGGPDRGQPTRFLPGRNWGLFTVTVPGRLWAKQNHLDAGRQRQNHRDPGEPPHGLLRYRRSRKPRSAIRRRCWVLTKAALPRRVRVRGGSARSAPLRWGRRFL